MDQNSSGVGLIGAAIILSISILGSAYLLSSSVDRATTQFEGAFANLEAFKPAAPSAPAARPSNKPDPNKVYEVAVGNAPYYGPKDAKVTIVEFSDFQ
ncbi:MAG: protein-disulfide isomerase [Myxococcota bacterium]